MELLVSIYGGMCRIVREVGRKERIEMVKKRENEGKKKKKKQKNVMAWKRGAWSAEEDRKLVEYVTAHGDKKWRTLAAKAGMFPSPFLLTPRSQHDMHEPVPTLPQENDGFLEHLICCRRCCGFEWF